MTSKREHLFLMYDYRKEEGGSLFGSPSRFRGSRLYNNQELDFECAMVAFLDLAISGQSGLA